MFISDKTDLKLTTWKPDEPFRGLVLLNLDNCIIWNPQGKKRPSSGKLQVVLREGLAGWVWGLPEADALIAYFKILFDSGFFPLFYSAYNEPELYRELADTIIEREGIVPPVWFATTPDKIYTSLVAKGMLDKFATFIPNFSVASLCPIGQTKIPNLGVYTFETLGYNVERRFPKSSLLVLMGQPGSGKSTVAAKLKAAGWKVYDEKEAGKLQKKQVAATKDLNSQLALVKTGKLPGVVVDATHPSAAKRQFYMALAKAMGVEYHTGWITRPGWESNATRTVGKVPDIALNMYVKNFEPPTAEEAPIRLI